MGSDAFGLGSSRDLPRKISRMREEAAVALRLDFLGLLFCEVNESGFKTS